MLQRRLFSEVENAIIDLFGQLKMPAGGINVTWLENVRTLRTLIADATETFGEPATVLVAAQTAQLEGSAQAVWAISAGLEEVSRTISSLEKSFRHFDENALSEETPLIDRIATYIN